MEQTKWHPVQLHALISLQQLNEVSTSVTAVFCFCSLSRNALCCVKGFFFLLHVFHFLFVLTVFGKQRLLAASLPRQSNELKKKNLFH